MKLLIVLIATSFTVCSCATVGPKKLEFHPPGAWVGSKAFFCYRTEEAPDTLGCLDYKSFVEYVNEHPEDFLKNPGEHRL